MPRTPGRNRSPQFQRVFVDTGSGLSITAAADLTAVSAVVPEGSEFVRYAAPDDGSSTLPDERYIEIKLFVLAQKRALYGNVIGGNGNSQAKRNTLRGKCRMPPVWW